MYKFFIKTPYYNKQQVLKDILKKIPVFIINENENLGLLGALQIIN